MEYLDTGEGLYLMKHWYGCANDVKKEPRLFDLNLVKEKAAGKKQFLGWQNDSDGHEVPENQGAGMMWNKKIGTFSCRIALAWYRKNTCNLLTLLYVL